MRYKGPPRPVPNAEQPCDSRTFSCSFLAGYPVGSTYCESYELAGERAAVAMCLVQSATLFGHHPSAYLGDALRLPTKDHSDHQYRLGG